MSNVTECACKTEDVLGHRALSFICPNQSYLSIPFGTILMMEVFVKYGKVASFVSFLTSKVFNYTLRRSVETYKYIVEIIIVAQRSSMKYLYNAKKDCAQNSYLT